MSKMLKSDSPMIQLFSTQFCQCIHALPSSQLKAMEFMFTPTTSTLTVFAHLHAHECQTWKITHIGQVKQIVKIPVGLTLKIPALVNFSKMSILVKLGTAKVKFAPFLAS